MRNVLGACAGWGAPSGYHHLYFCHGYVGQTMRGVRRTVAANAGRNAADYMFVLRHRERSGAQRGATAVCRQCRHRRRRQGRVERQPHHHVDCAAECRSRSHWCRRGAVRGAASSRMRSRPRRGRQRESRRGSRPSSRGSSRQPASPAGGKSRPRRPFGEWNGFDPVANLEWATALARGWAPDARLTRINLTRVSAAGTLDLAAGADDVAGYRFVSPAKVEEWNRIADTQASARVGYELMIKAAQRKVTAYLNRGRPSSATCRLPRLTRCGWVRPSWRRSAGAGSSSIRSQRVHGLSRARGLGLVSAEPVPA